MASNIINPLSQSEIESFISQSNHTFLKDKIQNHLTTFFENENFNGKESEIQDRLYKMIDYASDRYEYYSDQRHKFLNLGLSFIGISATFIGIIVSKDNTLSENLKICGYIDSIILFITGIIMTLIYNSYTTADYPYRKIMDIQSWYFKYKFSDKLDYKISKRKAKSDRQLLEVTKGYLDSVYNWTNKSKIKNYFIKEDIEQVAILHLLQKYGRDCVNKMKNTMSWGIGFFIATPILMFIKELIVQLIDHYK
jgi:hypothetical protein